MDIRIFIILSLLLVWIIFYQFYKAKWTAAARLIKSKSLRNMVKGFLKISYAVSLIAVVLIWVIKIASLFSNKGGKA